VMLMDRDRDVAELKLMKSEVNLKSFGGLDVCRLPAEPPISPIRLAVLAVMLSSSALSLARRIVTNASDRTCTNDDPTTQAPRHVTAVLAELVRVRFASCGPLGSGWVRSFAGIVPSRNEK